MEPSPLQEKIRKNLSKFESKDSRYDRTIARKFLQAMGADSRYMSMVSKQWSSDYGLSTLVQNHLVEDRVALQAVKLKSPVSIYAMLRGAASLEKLPVWTAWRSMHDDWYQFRHYALIFDHHGDGIGDLVLHNMHPILPVSEGGARLRVAHPDEEMSIDSLDQFLPLFGQRFNI